jgi:hypothetical protein
MEALKMWVSENGGWMMSVALVMAAVNVALMGLKSSLDMVKDKTATQADNKAAEWLGWATGWLSTLVDWLAGNKKH